MAVTFEFTVGKGFHFAEAFGERFKMPVKDNRVYLPNFLGKGYIQEIALREGLSICLHHYRLEEDFNLRRLPNATPSKMLTLKFDFRKTSDELNMHLSPQVSEAELGTGNFFTEVSFAVQQEIYFMVINITRELLVDLLQLGENETPLKTKLLHSSSFVTNILMPVKMEYVLRKFGKVVMDTPFALLQYQSKTYELIYLFFLKLTNCFSSTAISVNREDADKLYKVRSIILSDLSVIPILTDLSKEIAMSPTKMKMLFRQIFGTTIYNYFQMARMNEASKLLQDYSVSETGYKLGFTNMSHFSRQFEKHFELKPKKYKDNK